MTDGPRKPASGVPVFSGNPGLQPKRSDFPAPVVRTSARSETDRPLGLDFTDPQFRRYLSPEDEKRTDHQGRPAVMGLPWSAAGTGLWLMIGCTNSKPQVPHDGFWGALELPSDLATDPLKKKYITEWICAEVDKAIRQTGL